MTEDTSPENLRKFLESDDPVMVQQGLSIAKAGVPDELFPTILRLYMWGHEETIRAEAKSIFNKCSSEDIQKKIKENWNDKYRTIYHTEQISEWIGKSISEIDEEKPVKTYIRSSKNPYTSNIIGETTQKISLSEIRDQDLHYQEEACGLYETKNRKWDKNSFIPLPKTRSFTGNLGRDYTLVAIRFLEAFKSNDTEYELGKVILYPIIKKLKELYHMKTAAKTTFKKLNIYPSATEYKITYLNILGNIGDKRTVEIATIMLGDKPISVRKAAAQTLGKIGDKGAVKPLINTFKKENLGLTKVSANAIIEIKKGNIKEEKNILKFLKSKDPAMVLMGASMLKGILEE